MAVVFVQEWDSGDDRSTTNYDAVAAEIAPEADKPEGLIVHTAGFTADGVFRIFDVWESEDHLKRFESERLMPAVQKALGTDGGAGPPSRQYTYELHDVVRG